MVHKASICLTKYHLSSITDPNTLSSSRSLESSPQMTLKTHTTTEAWDYYVFSFFMVAYQLMGCGWKSISLTETIWTPDVNLLFDTLKTQLSLILPSLMWSFFVTVLSFKWKIAHWGVCITFASPILKENINWATIHLKQQKKVRWLNFSRHEILNLNLEFHLVITQFMICPRCLYMEMQKLKSKGQAFWYLLNCF